MHKIKWLFVLCFVFHSIRGNGQTDLFVNLDSEYYQMKVKSIDDFIGRFNYEQDPRGNTLKYSDSLQNNRLKLILSLFDDSLINNNEDSISIATIKDFLKVVNCKSNPIFFNYYSLNWYAEAYCPVLFNGKRNYLSFFLKTFQDKKGNTKWVIYDVREDFIEFPNKNPEIFIGPAAHNLNFLDISKTTDANPQNFESLLANDFKPDHLSVITYLIAKKTLKIQSVEKLQFHVYQVPGFYFRIINRDEMKRGWLITEIKRI